jgi:hypothetical protein
VTMRMSFRSSFAAGTMSTMTSVAEC